MRMVMSIAALTGASIAVFAGTALGRSPDPPLEPGSVPLPPVPVPGPVDPVQAADLEPSGLGIFINVSNARRGVADVLAAIRGDDRVAGVQANVDWAQLEPVQGSYDWRPIDSLLVACGAAGKKAALKFCAASGKLDPNEHYSPDTIHLNTATPAWLFADPNVWRLGGIDTPEGRLPLYPVYWDPAYQAHLDDFLAAMAERYDDEPRLEFIRMGGWQVGTNEPSFYGGAEPYLHLQLASFGMELEFDARGNLVHMADGKYAQAVQELLDIWWDNFTATRLAATIHFDRGPRSFETAMNQHAASLGVIMLNTGLNEGDHRSARVSFRSWHDEFGAKVGWGGITSLGSKLSEEELAQLPHSLRMEMFLQGIGLDDDPNYHPAAKVSYLVFGKDVLEHDEEIDWAAANLVP